MQAANQLREANATAHGHPSAKASGLHRGTERWLEKFGAITALSPFHPTRTESTFFEVGEECGCGEKKNQNLIRRWRF